MSCSVIRSEVTSEAFGSLGGHSKERYMGSSSSSSSSSSFFSGKIKLQLTLRGHIGKGGGRKRKEHFVNYGI